MTSKKDISNVSNLFYKEHCSKFKTLSVIVTNKCNMNCDFCIWKKQNHAIEEIDLELLEKVLIDGKKWGYSRVSLTGGELGLHSRFKELISLIVKHGYRFTFVTNAKRWELYKFLVEEYKDNLYSLAISLDGDKETHDKYRGNGSYEKVIEAVKYFKLNGCDVSLKFAVGSHNYQDFWEVIEIASKLGVELEIFPIICNNQFKLSSSQVDSIYKTISQHEQLLSEYSEKIDIRIVDFEIRRLDFCQTFSNKEINILSNGKVCLCCGMDFPEFIIGDLRKDDVEQILKQKNELIKKIINKFLDTISKPDFNGVEVPDYCSFCRYALGCNKFNEEFKINKFCEK